MFPQGGPGFGLLLLRLSVAAAFLYAVSARLALPNATWIVPLSGLIVVILLLGLLTPAFSLIACGLFLYLCMGQQTPNLYIFSAFALASISLSLLGPGAYSLDARLFGRRVLVLPTDKNPKNDDLE